VDYPKGDSENPLSTDELIAKFRGMVAGIVPDAQAEALIQNALDIENVRIAEFFSS
jgi:2-methylcitrate dehydratase PrpD